MKHRAWMAVFIGCVLFWTLVAWVIWG
ncbi:YmiA family putative membrane protein [Salmonella enterica]|nr:YmiA family putative membrane protein [Salmonella enterica]MLR77452.1 YmiA family putative membrane protein [Salmonella enterica subsp. salamae]HCM2004238.1 YmiA family putative membrane protein [Salmonella enterica subsp. salamae serovar 21:z10:[z6]]